jgi:hypothetical protein
MEIMIVLATLLTTWAVWAGLSAWIKRSGKRWHWKPVPAICASFAGMIVLVVGAALGGYGNRVEPVATASGPVAVTPVPPMAPAETDAPVAEAAPPEPIVAASSQSSTPANAKAPASVPALDLRPAEYVEELNRLLKTLGFDHRAKVELKSGKALDSLVGDLGGHMSYLAMISKDTGKIVQVRGVGASDGTDASAFKTWMLSAAVMAAAVPEVSYEEMLKAIPELLASGEKGVTETAQYSVVASKGLAVWFIVEPLARAN